MNYTITIEKDTIQLKLVYQEEEYLIYTNKNQYTSLMSLIVDHLGIPGFGLCCVMESCGTCMIDIQEKYSLIKRSVLSCGISITDELANTTITISEAIY